MKIFLLVPENNSSVNQILNWCHNILPFQLIIHKKPILDFYDFQILDSGIKNIYQGSEVLLYFSDDEKNTKSEKELCISKHWIFVKDEEKLSFMILLLGILKNHSLSLVPKNILFSAFYHDRVSKTNWENMDLGSTVKEEFYSVAWPEMRSYFMSFKQLPIVDQGADIAELIPLSSEKMGVFVVDAAGIKKSAIRTAGMARIIFLSIIWQMNSLEKVIKIMNEVFQHIPWEIEDVSLFLGLMDFNTHLLKYINTGVNPPLWIHNGTVSPLHIENYLPISGEVHFFGQERLLFFTQGLLQVHDSQDWNQNQFQSWLLERVNYNTDRIVAELEVHLNQLDRKSHISYLMLEKMGSFSNDRYWEEKLNGRGRRFVFNSDIRHINHVKNRIVQMGEDICPRESATLCDLGLMVAESVTNGICHGNKNDLTKMIVVEVTFEENSVRISVEDEGEGFDPDLIPDALAPENLEKTHGRGIFLIRCLGFDVEFNSKANRILFRKSYSQ